MRKLGVVLIILCLPYGLFSLLMYSLQDKIMFQPEKLPADYTYNFNLPFNEIDLAANDGTVLNALYFEAEAPEGLILYFHGNAGNLARWGQIASSYVAMGYDVLVMDYRGYGKSQGKPSETELYKDAQLFYNLATERYTEDEIVVFGRSLGSALATRIAAENAPSKLVLETPFYSVRDVANTRFRYLPVQWLLKYEFPSFSYAPEVTCPVIILHGTDDTIVPFDSGKRLSEHFTTSNLQFVSIPGGAHNNLINFKQFNDSLSQFLSK